MPEGSRFCPACGAAAPVRDTQAQSPTGWRTYAIIQHVVALVAVCTLLALFREAPRPTWSGATMWVATGAGGALMALGFGLVGLAYRRNRLAAFFAASWAVVVLIASGTFK